MLNASLKKKIVTDIIQQPDFLGKYSGYDDISAFLSKIWPLEEMPSDDFRFKNAGEDIFQHIVANNDWDYEYLFITRLKLIEGDDEFFNKFIETIVSPEIRNTRDDILVFVSLINKSLQNTDFKLVNSGYFEGLPIYKIRDRDDVTDLPPEMPENTIPFYRGDSNADKQYPCFIIGHDNWNDWGIMTLVTLFYCESPKIKISLGWVKLMKKGENTTWVVLPDNFLTLPKDYCSLGQNKEYYLQLKKSLGENYQSALFALRDVAFFPKIHEEFESNKIFIKSLIRDNSLEKLMRTIRFEIDGFNPNDYYKFNYTYQLPYAENNINLNFNFDYNPNIGHRIYALIGKNGTGKTKILSSLARNLSERNPANITPHKPIYAKVFTISYSIFDSFDIPDSDASFNYVYCGLKKKDGSWLTQDELWTRFFESSAKITEKEIENDWFMVLLNFIPQDLLEIAFEKENSFKFNPTLFSQLAKKLSSGQNILIFIITEILSQIRFNSLILYDEPETHLHPNAITDLMNTLFDLTKRFESFCIIATHSPLIIQEIPSKNIFVIEREENAAFVRRLERESFGENLTVITEDIFGNREVSRHYITLIQDLVKTGKTYEEIIKILESDNLPATLNTRLYIKGFISQKENEES